MSGHMWVAVSDFNSFTKAFKTFADDFTSTGKYDTCSISISKDTDTRVDFTMSKDSTICPVCNVVYQTWQQFDLHKTFNPTGCSMCKKCFAKDDYVVHALEYAHDRCFVVGCPSRERESRGWETFAIESHVRNSHGLSQEPELPVYSRKA